MDKDRLNRLYRAAMMSQEYSKHAVTRMMRSNRRPDDQDIVLNTICEVVCALLEELLEEENE